MSTAQIYRWQFRDNVGEIGMAPLPLWKEIMNYLFAVLIFVMTVGTILTVNGAMPVASVVIVGILSVLYIFGGRIEYISYGQLHIEMSTDHPNIERMPDDTGESSTQKPRAEQTE